MSFAFSVQDITIAAGLALFITWLINALIMLLRTFVHRSTEFDYSPRQLESVMDKCCAHFPTEHLRFENRLYKRGMRVRVSTFRNKTFEGQFIGINNENMICIITQHRVVAQELGMIHDIELI